jgi:hypothetical protein
MRPLTWITLTCCSLSLFGCEDVDCPALYESSPVKQCMDVREFTFYGCIEHRITRPECFRSCVEPLTDGPDLCYEVEDCQVRCSDDDATGCDILYSTSNRSCIDYKTFFREVCDPRADTEKSNCVKDCYTKETGCVAFESCRKRC